MTEASLAPSPEDGMASCERGTVPAHITVAAGNIDAPIEVIETVDGVMQAPDRRGRRVVVPRDQPPGGRLARSSSPVT